MNVASSKNLAPRRSGTATVEAAVCLPMLLLLVFGSLESSNALFLKQSLSIAAYEAAKAASLPQGTMVFAEQRCREVLAIRDVDDFEISFSPPDIGVLTERGTQIAVTITVGADSAALGPIWVFSGKKLTTTMYMVRL